MRQLLSLAAVFVFLLGLIAIQAKTRGEQQLNKSVRRVSPSPTVSVDSNQATLRFYDETSKKPLSGQSILLTITPYCPANSPCPENTPLVVMADAEGRVNVSQELVRAKPKIYAIGYKLDTYFSFADPTKPNELTIYKGLEGGKTVYDIAYEEVPVLLTVVSN